MKSLICCFVIGVFFLFGFTIIHNPDSNSAIHNENSPMISFFVFLEVEPDSIEVFYKAISNLAKGSINEPECYRYEILKDQKDSTKFYVYEVFKNKKSHEFHVQTDHYKNFSAGHLIKSFEYIEMDVAFPKTDTYMYLK